MANGKAIVANMPVSPCPWCDKDTPLGLRADGMGGTALWCIECGCKGPSVQISGDFDEADRAAVQRWSRRNGTVVRLPAPIYERLQHAMNVQHFIHGQNSHPEAMMSIRTSDLSALLQAVGIALPI